MESGYDTGITGEFSCEDEFYNLDYLLDHCLGSIGEKQMSFIKEENHSGFIKVAYLGKLFKQFGHHPEKESCINRTV